MLKKAPAAGSDLSEALRKLQRGEIDVEAYLDECVEVAMAHLAGQLDDDALESVREAIRAQARMDPVVRDVIDGMTRRDRALPPSG